MDPEHLKMMAKHSFEMFGTTYPLMQEHIPED
jgi:hypothetical protein